MKRRSNIPIKVGDSVQIISGSHKGEMGDVTQVNRKTGKIYVQGINLRFKHAKPLSENEVGEIKKITAPLHHSNVKVNLKETS